MHRPPIWFYAVAGLSIFWALVGCYSYLAQVTMSARELADLPPAQAEMITSMPGWLTGAYAIAVWTGLAGAICLLLRLRFARQAFIVSLVGIVVMFGYLFVATPMIANMGIGATYFPIFIFVVGVAELAFTHWAIGRDWL